jgi:hypothetical protein
MMSFSGKLEYLPIIDIMQLLHQTRKSGILRVKSRKGESQLVFKDGYMVSANHLNNSLRIGKILVDLNFITPENLDKALQIQSRAGIERKPLIITLIDEGLVNERDAYKALEYLIEIAIVEILTWKKGSFSLEVLPTSISDFRFYPGKLISEINIDTQSVLMDALRIFDEKMRDGELTDGDPQEDEISAEETDASFDIESRQSQQTGKVEKKEIPSEKRLVSCPHCNNAIDVDKCDAVRSTDMMYLCPVCRYSTHGTEMFSVCPQCGLVGSKYQEKLRKGQDMAWEQRHTLHIQELLMNSRRIPDMIRAGAAYSESEDAPSAVRYISWACFFLGGMLLCSGLYGLATFYGNDWRTILSEGRWEPISKGEVFFRFGFLPWLFTLFSSAFLMAVRRFHLLRGHARKEMRMAAWAGIAVCIIYETTQFIFWERNSSEYSFSYVATGLASSFLMTFLWSLPFLVLLRLLRSKAIVREFPE